MAYEWLANDGAAGKMLSDPNILQGMGNAGAALSSGATVGEALNPADLIRNMQQQKATQQLLQQLLAGAGKGGAGGGVVSPSAWGNPDAPTSKLLTPESEAGPNSITYKNDGTFNMVGNSVAKPKTDPYGSSKPMESITSGGQNSPFWQTLLR